MSVVAMEVARRLQEDEGISCEVIDLRSLRPLDRPTLIASVQKTSRAVVIEEDWYSYGVGAEVVATVQEGAFDYLDAPIKRVAQAEVPLPYAKVMEQAALPKARNLVDAIQQTLKASGYRARTVR
jgi:pyruvate dehydrogenase E1 component beta subunit